ncbi:MAG: SMC-Scp complex subunit ScpB [Oscillospiraceae bacterium]
MNASKMQAAIEAVLFASGEPIHIKKLAEVIEVEVEEAQQLLLNLEAQLDERQSGICLLKLQDKYQLCTRTEFAQQVRSVLDIRRNTPLSQAAFEVLAVVAYNQPVTKSFVEQVRGVDCSGVMASLSQKGLIEEKGRLDLPGRPLIYGTTPEFLRCFCISSLDELPPLPNSETEVEDSEKGEEKQTLVEENEENNETVNSL